MRTLSWQALVPCLIAGWSCSPDRVVDSSDFNSPALVAIADHRLFVSNLGEDALQVLTLSKQDNDLGASTAVRAPNLYFPLRIPMPAHALAMQGSLVGDNAEVADDGDDGDYLLVLSAGGVLTVVDVDELSVIDTAALSLGSGALSLAAAPTGCAQPCRSTFFVGMDEGGGVVQVRLNNGADGEVSLSAGVAIPAAGAMAQLSISGNGRWLFASDSLQPEVVRFDLERGAVTRLAIGGFGGVLAANDDGSRVYVSRPALMDVVLLRGDENTLSLTDGDSAAQLGALPQCIAACSSNTACEHAHPMDQAICREDDAGGGFRSPDESSYPVYGGYYLGQPVGAMVLMTSGVEATAVLSLAGCGEDAANIVYDEALYMAAGDGTVRILGTRADGTPEWVREEACGTPGAEFGDEVGLLDISAMLQKCPTLPDRRRFICPGEGDKAVFGIQRGLTGSQTVTFDWEGVFIQRTGGGTLEAGATGESLFGDISINFKVARVEENDIVEITSTPSGAECPLVGATACELERRVKEVTEEGFLILDQELPSGCFNSGTINYQLRTGSSFLISLGGQLDARGGRGALISPDIDDGVPAGLYFRMADFDAQEGPACSRYQEGGVNAGQLVGHTDGVFRRTQRAPFLQFSITDGFAAREVGLVGGVPVGRFPVSATSSASPARIFFAFADGRFNAVLGLTPDVVEQGAPSSDNYIRID